MISVGIIGASGYTGIELLRFLLKHPHVDEVIAASRTYANKKISEVFTTLRGVSDLKFCDPSDHLLTKVDVVFFATPSGFAMEKAAMFLESGAKIIDLSPDFRIKNITRYKVSYEREHVAQDLLKEAVYGLPELNRKAIEGASLVANPGCYPTAVLLGLMPLLKSHTVVPGSIIADCKSGVSGAGRKADVGTLFCEVSDNFKAYGVDGHRHHAEILGIAEEVHQTSVGEITFVPHLTPMIRGLFATLYLQLEEGSLNVVEHYQQFYKNESFVIMLDKLQTPETRAIKGTNCCHIAIRKRKVGNRFLVLSAIDNLVKGASGQAVQNMNIMFRFPESTALDTIATLP